MITKDVKSLLGRLNGTLNVAIEAAAGLAVTKGHYEVFPDHLILKLLEEGSGDIPLILKHFKIEYEQVWNVLSRRMERFADGNTANIRFSRDLMELLESGWVISSIHFGHSRIRSGSLIEPYLEDHRFSSTPFGEEIESIEAKTLNRDFFDIVSTSKENVFEKTGAGEQLEGIQPSKEGQSALDQYTIDVTGNARNGEIDPVFGRDQEIRQLVDILSRRRKNNPILVGEAGVGKTAVVEGLALRIAEGDVVDSLKEVEIRGLDLGMLQAGASMKGEFENRLKKVITQVQEAGGRIILFIDEAHTLIGAGGAAGSGDAANLLKPALARGQLRTIGATTFSEYKKYIEKDPALERRFQMVKIDEPDEENAAIMLRGIKKIYEKHHKVTITDSAVKAAVTLSKRYIAGRQLPDKAVDLLDTSAARVKMTMTGKPKALEINERRRAYAVRELESLRAERDQGYKFDAREIEEVEASIIKIDEETADINRRCNEQQVVVDQIIELKKKAGLVESDIALDEEDADEKTETGEKEKKPDKHENKEAVQAEPDPAILKELVELREKLITLQGENPLMLADVDAGVVGSVVADWTGIPVGRMVKDQATALLDFEKIVGKNIIGQDPCLAEIANTIRVTKSGMGKQDNPIGVFLFVGPSGVGKTETAIYTAEVIFGGRKFMTTINMSEYQEKHTVSQLKGSPPGYVGYGEGGVLTEAVRRRPYSVVLLDEVEKADPEVMNLFYQVFDKGFMRDGEGREIDFKNTVVMMTSNLGSDIMMDACANGERPDLEKLSELIRPTLTNHFQAALLARIKVIPFYPLDKDSIKKIVDLKLSALGKRLVKAHRIKVEYDEAIVDAIATQCTVAASGARNIDYILDRSLLPSISRSLVEKLSQDEMPERLVITGGEDGTVSHEFR